MAPEPAWQDRDEVEVGTEEQEESKRAVFTVRKLTVLLEILGNKALPTAVCRFRL